MAIKVIKHGTKKFPQNCTCPECHCEFTFESEDLRIDYSLCLTTYPVQYRRYVICPDCGKRIYIDTISEEPEGVPSPRIVYKACQNSRCNPYLDPLYADHSFNKGPSSGIITIAPGTSEIKYPKSSAVCPENPGDAGFVTLGELKNILNDYELKPEKKGTAGFNPNLHITPSSTTSATSVNAGKKVTTHS